MGSAESSPQGLPGLKSRCWQVPFLLEALGVEFAFRLLQVVDSSVPHSWRPEAKSVVTGC